MRIRNQKGLTLLGFLIALVVGLFFVYGAMRIIPMYLEYHALVNAMNGLVEDPQAKSMPASKIKQKIEMSLWASYASNNIGYEHMRVSKKSDGVNVRVAYEVRKPFIGNIDLIGTFENTVVLR
jgi:hypothetical protein